MIICLYLIGFFAVPFIAFKLGGGVAAFMAWIGYLVLTRGDYEGGNPENYL